MASFILSKEGREIQSKTGKTSLFCGLTTPSEGHRLFYFLYPWLLSGSTSKTDPHPPHTWVENPHKRDVNSFSVKGAHRPVREEDEKPRSWNLWGQTHFLRDSPCHFPVLHFLWILFVPAACNQIGFEEELVVASTCSMSCPNLHGVKTLQQHRQQFTLNFTWPICFAFLLFWVEATILMYDCVWPY